jgi:HK97 family phage portal protein
VKLLDTILGRKPQPKPADALPFFKTFTSYTPTFTSFNGGVYELELTRSAIDRFATACSKLKPEIVGTAKKQIERAIRTSPNDWQTWPQFLYRLATILECDTTAYVVPELSPRDGVTITGLWPLKCQNAELVEYKGQPWIRFYFVTGDTAAIEMSNVCIISKFQYTSDIFGERNNLQETMKLLVAQNEAQQEAIKTGATNRFIGSLIGQVREEEIQEKRDRFGAQNLSEQNKSGIMLYDQTFNNVEQIKPYSYAISDGEMNRITQNVFNYFGTNQNVLQNSYNEEEWNAYYEGKVEPFALQLGEGLSHMLFTQQERYKNQISFSSNRLEYATSPSKRNMIRDMIDRGIFCIDDAREILQMPPLPNGEGQMRVIRGEYIDSQTLKEVKADKDSPSRDEMKQDSDRHGTGDTDNLDE